MFDGSSPKMMQAAEPPASPTATRTSAVAPTPVTGWAAFTAKPEADRRKDEDAKKTEKAASKTDITHGHPTRATQGKVDEAKALSARQLTDVNTTLKERAVEAKVPPHLRAKASAAAAPAKKPVQSSAELISVQHVSAPSDTKPKSNGVQSAAIASHPHNTPSTEVKTPGPVHSPDKSDLPAPPLQTTPKPIMTNGTSDKHAEASTAATDSNNVVGALKLVNEELQKLNQRMGSIENDQFSTWKQLETVAQAEERRKFLGTKNAKEPFGLDVECGKYIFQDILATTRLMLAYSERQDVHDPSQCRA